jgi:hypothetical protein
MASDFMAASVVAYGMFGAGNDHAGESSRRFAGLGVNAAGDVEDGDFVDFLTAKHVRRAILIVLKADPELFDARIGAQRGLQKKGHGQDFPATEFHNPACPINPWSLFRSRFIAA